MARPGSKDTAERPIFITGVYRSGTTLPAQILNAHSKLCITYDTVQYFRFYLERFNPVSEHYEDIVNDVAKRLKQRFSISVPKERILERLNALPSIEHRDVWVAIMRETFCGHQPDIHWGEKSVLEWTRIPLFLDMFPGGQAIMIIRDPRDILASYREFTIEPPHRYLDAVFACLHSMGWAAKVGQKLSQDRYYLLRHEDLVLQPQATVTSLCRFLQVEYEPQMLDTAGFKDHQGSKPWQPNTAFRDVSLGDGIAPHTTERWRSNLDSFETVFIESVLGDLLEHFGYKPSKAKVDATGLAELWERLRTTPLLQSRLQHWLSTGEGVESYPSDPTDPKNWAKGMGPRGTKLE